MWKYNLPNLSQGQNKKKKKEKASNPSIKFKYPTKISTAVYCCHSFSGTTPLFPTSWDLLHKRHYRLCGYIDQWHLYNALEAMDLITHLTNHLKPASLISIPYNLSNMAYSWLNRQWHKAICFL